MGNCIVTTVLIAATAALLVSCAASPEVQARYQAREDRIGAILAEAAQTTDLGAPKRCLGDVEFRSFRALDDQYVLFEGPRGKQWVNKLQTRCPDLQYASVLQVRSFSAMRVCHLDGFYPGDWFDWPWYRRWPWNWGRWPSGMRCTLGVFQPVNDEHVSAIEAVLHPE
jgi:hypothetical protein